MSVYFNNHPPSVYSHCHPGVHLFDPHWGEDGEPGGDPLGTLTRLHAALHGDKATCNEACWQHLLRVVSVHVRGRVALQRLRGAGHARVVLTELAGRFAEARGLLALVDGDGIRDGDFLAASFLMMLLTRMFAALHDVADAVDARPQGVWSSAFLAILTAICLSLCLCGRRHTQIQRTHSW